MPPKKSDPLDEVAYVKACLKHYKEPMAKANFNFEEVAKETGLKDATAAYQKFWGIKQKWGMTGARTAASPKATKAAGTPKKTNGATAGATTGAAAGAGKKRGANGNVKAGVNGGSSHVGPAAGGGESDAGSVDANHGSDPVEGGSEAETEVLEDGKGIGMGKAKKVKTDVDED